MNAETGITESSTYPPTHQPCHRPTGSVMPSVGSVLRLESDGRWVGVVEGNLLQRWLAAGG